MRFVQLEIPEKTYNHLQYYANIKNTSVTALVKMMASNYLKDEREKEIEELKDRRKHV